MFDVNNLAAMQVGLASPEDIISWSKGEVTKSETINYRSQKPEMGGLFCEKIFGPAKDYECHCGKYKKIRYQGITCEKCGVEVISKEWRRERFGHIHLISPCSHIWYLKGIPSRMSLILEIPPKQLEDIVYYAAHIVLDKGNSKILADKQYLNESAARIAFKDVIENEIMPTLEIDSLPYQKAEAIVAKLGDPNETFDYFSSSNFISRNLKTVFGEGAEAVKDLLRKVNIEEESNAISEAIKATKSEGERQRLVKRLEVVEAFRKSGQKPEWMVLDDLPVIPPDLRPMLQLDGGRFAASDFNELYRRVISRNNRLKKLIDINSPNVILINEKRMLQEAVDALIDNGRRNKPVTGPSGRALKSLSSGLKGKQGRFRQNLLGKRVDFSGRSVIAVGPSLKMYQCGLPREMAIQLLRPFIAALLIKEGYVSAHKQADKIIDRYDPIVFDIVDRIISQHPVLLNRAPTLHRLGIQAFQPILVDGRAIRLHPLVCPGFNADFDGDQMAVHVPLGKAAQEEALKLMLASNNILGPKDGKPIVIPGQDMVMGNYYLTIEESKNDFLERAKALRSLTIADEEERIANEEEALRQEGYAEMEGHVFASIREVIDAYENRIVSLHNRIGIRASVLHKKFYGPEAVGVEWAKGGLPIEVKDQYLLTSVGKIIFNEIFPDDFIFINGDEPNVEKKETILSWFVPAGTDIKEAIASQPLHGAIKKKWLGAIIDMSFHKYDMSDEATSKLTPSKTSAILDKIKDQGFEYSTVSAVTVAISDIDISKLTKKGVIVAESQKKVDKIAEMAKKGLLSEGERHNLVTSVWSAATEGVRDEVAAHLQKDKSNPLVIMFESGARGSIDNFKQLMGMKGCVANPKNETIELPIISSYREGLKVAEFFINTHGARKGGADTALKTADSGYLTRRLVDVSQDVVVREIDCHCDHGFKVREIRDTSRDVVIATLDERLSGRFSMRDIVDPNTGEVIVKANAMITDLQAKQIVAAGIKEVEIRSLFTCQTKNGVCQHCYGRNMATGRLVEVGEAVGIMAAQSIGEPGTQLTMRVFHTGGLAGSDITTGLPRVQELVEARPPKGVAKISKIDGVVKSIEHLERGSYKVIIESVHKAVDSEVKEGEVEVDECITDYGSRLRVKVGDHVENGGKITEGAINPKELLDVSDVEKVEVYMIKEIRKVYAAQGIGISDKHLEIIVRQMLRKVYVLDKGDTDLIPGTRVDVDTYTLINQAALLAGKKPALAHPFLLGITKAALETESFLSAASFQETTRVLTDAAIKAKKDPLHGLKENVITGKLIPAGTGLFSEEAEAERLKDFSVEGHMALVKDQYLEDHDRHEKKD
ncbi:MAG: DNA-directed RNA polymerase subunit beta' [Bacilli bacterium]|nr:DNA-directed RNA polymerase subunit beta' [Bacilli bacterium]